MAFFFKQWGEWGRSIGLASTHWIDRDGTVREAGASPYVAGFAGIRRVGKKRAGALLDGREHREFPAVAELHHVAA
ncbi:DUF5131 family protein [Parvibaculum sp.]|uniref:DUF5131 family protein n=1 Tax=Parvibaculum sp. TaxID=2024848 RepID=UPI0035265396